jgi:hypothetical protein
VTAAHDKRIPCRVCGEEFTPARWDAVTCTDTCRQRLHRGGDLAYLADLPPKVRRAEQALQDALASSRAASREVSRTSRAARAAKRDLKLFKVKDKLRRTIEAEMQLKQIFDPVYQEAQGLLLRRRQKQRGVVAAALKLFVDERRNDMSASAIAAYLDWPVEDVERALGQLRASGHYDRILDGKDFQPLASD